MADLTKLAKLLQELDDQMVGCMKCGMCQAVCPVFAETMKEADVTRGKIALLENLAKEMIHDAAGVQEKLNKCLLCGSCGANCPSGVKVMDIFLRARVIVNTYMGLSPVKKAILRGMLTKPALFNALLDLGSKFQGIFTSKVDDLLGSSCSKVLSPVIGDRHFVGLAKQSLHSKIKALDTPAGKSGKRVAFFPGCLGDKMFVSVAEACLKVFEHHGVGVYMPEGQACCGIPAISSGDRVAYDKLVKINLDLFSKGGFDYLVTPCATCTATIKEIWPKLMDEYPATMRDQIRALHDKVMDVNQFVVDVLGVAPEAPAKGGVKVTFHDSCHMKKSLGVTSQPRALIGMNPKYELVEMAECDRCCGSGGSFNLYHYDLSKQIGERKRDNILATGAQIVSTGCPACMLQMTDMLSQHGAKVAVKHSIELYADSLR
ncbi:(Fe-S)-binding protein [Nitratidesulfovibrio sp. SRB-5]|uniref:(Fe-S)-binding protein n=1 Tax=Nitratidesulfovibrio sp. SRB-5 TaxID=2872636 RepID=UPI00167EFE32|nr:(Fe-S)-binding protein [Nitratidesulfovibrio sp. SRB-5]MBZ2171974.1 (Fe-S)-binding protein [Nitratidesulfovibrio sp. SRB-5]